MTRWLPWLVLTVLMAAPAGAQPAKRAKDNAKGKSMTSAEFDQLIKAKDWSAVEVSRQAGPGAVSTLTPYLRNPDYLIRLLAVDCISAAGGQQAPPLMIQMLQDTNEQVRINAINGLHQNLPVGHEADLLRAWDLSQTRDAFVRQQIPMILGRMHSATAIPLMKTREKADPRPEVHDGMVAGLSKLGDQAARQTFGEMLRDARGKRTADLIEYVKYVDEPWVIPLLVPVLSRREMAIDLSTHRREIHRRECDLAADQVMRISGARFSFPIDEIAQYTDAQIAEVQRFAQGAGH